MSDQRPDHHFHSGLFPRLALRFSRKHECPFCNSPAICREKRHGIFQRLICATLGVRPYLCSDCDQFHYARYRKSSSN
jgi:hypothetical protein